ncbi:MAG: DUF4091 domain-containing protein [Ruminococcaceae bacterium]|nr:DUF4091 domain-containing protein [Oscillospiraceae bacterium]
MKKLLTLALTGAMLLSCAVSVFADDSAGLTLAEGSHLKVENGIVDMIDGAITVGELKAEFAGAVDVAGKADDAAVCADDVVTAGGESAKAIIWGDASKDGKITLTDATKMLQSIAKWSVDVSTTAADVDRNDKVNLSDVSKLMQKLAKWDNISLGNVRMVFENKALTAEHEDPTLKISFTNFMNKVGAHATDHTGENAFKMKMARNESESCTVLLWSDADREGMTAELSDFVHEYGDATMESDLEWVIYYPDLSVFTTVMRDGKVTPTQETYTDDHPEVIVDMADSFELKAAANQQFVITVKSNKETPAGMYTATFTVKDAEGKEVKKATVYAYVWDFTLPDTPYSASLFGTATGTSYIDYYYHMLEQNLSSYKLPYHILSDEAEEVMSDPRVTAFNIDGFSAPYTGDITDEETVLAYNKIKNNPEWFKKGLFYYTDEPWCDGLLKVQTTYEYVTKLLGTTEIRNITPLADNTWVSPEHEVQNIDAVAFIDPYINVWCPRSDAYRRLSEGGLWTNRYMHRKHGDYADRAEKFREKGEEIWWYICIAPQLPYPNYFTFYQGVINRLVLWQQYFNNVDGLLYYATGMSWETISKYQFKLKDYGDGCLQFPGEKWGRTGPQASWRLYQIRDSFDDFDYMKIAEELVGREEVMKAVTKVSSGMLKYTEDYRVLDAARDEIVQMILDSQDK